MRAASDGRQVAAGTAGAPAGGVLQPPLTRAVVWLAAVASGLAVASVYYAQPLLDAIALEFGWHAATVVVVVTRTLVGYGIGLLMLVPLGVLVDRRRLIVCQTACSVLALGVAEGKLLWYSWQMRDVAPTVQGLLLDEGSDLAGRRVFHTRWNLADRFVLELLAKAFCIEVSDAAEFMQKSRVGD